MQKTKKVRLKFIKLFFVTFLLVNTNALAQKNEACFKSGEKIEMIMSYGWFDGGIATLHLSEKWYNGKKVFHSKAVAKTIGLADKMFSVYDIYESYFDKTTYQPYRAIRNVREHNYKFYNEVFFDHVADTLYSQKSGMHKVPENIFDIVSMFYYLRANCFKGLKVGDAIEMTTYFIDEVYPLKIRYMGVENVEIGIGTFSCLKFSPVVEPGRVFDTEDDLTIWVSNDKNYIPIRVRYNLYIGSFDCDLKSYSGLTNKFSSKID